MLTFPVLPPLPDTPEGLLEAYRLWWDPTAPPRWWLWPGPVYVMRPARPHCGRWYPLPAEVPATARWALVCQDTRPGRVLYTKSRAAAISLFEQIALRDHAHTRIVPVGKEQPSPIGAAGDPGAALS